jgi:hypothetical protein
MKLLLAAFAIAPFLIVSGVALAQDVDPTDLVELKRLLTENKGGDSFPAALGYAAIALATAVWGTLTAVVGHLWNRNGKQTVEFQAVITRIKAEYKAEVDELRAENAVVQKQWREEAERLLREQRDIFKEAMLTNGAVGTALQDLTNMIQRLDSKWSGEE